MNQKIEENGSHSKNNLMRFSETGKRTINNARKSGN